MALIEPCLESICFFLAQQAWSRGEEILVVTGDSSPPWSHSDVVQVCGQEKQGQLGVAEELLLGEPGEAGHLLGDPEGMATVVKREIERRGPAMEEHDRNIRQDGGEVLAEPG